jgi:hypothetical protein
MPLRLANGGPHWCVTIKISLKPALIEPRGWHTLTHAGRRSRHLESGVS